MQQLTVRVDDETGEAIDERASDSDVSTSEAVRELLRLGFDHERLQAEVDDLRRQLQAVNRRESEHQELVEYVQRERALQERREERARRREKRKQRRQAATILQRAWWAIAGDPYVRQEEA